MNANDLDGTYYRSGERVDYRHGYFVSEFGQGEILRAGATRDDIHAAIGRVTIPVGYLFGVWTADDGTVYVDLTRHHGSWIDALTAALDGAQLAVWDIERGAAVDIHRVAVDYPHATVLERIDGYGRGHVAACETCGFVIGRTVTRKPAQKRATAHDRDAHGIVFDTWTESGEYVDSDTGDTLTVERDTAPNSFGWQWYRFDAQGTELQHGTAGTESAAQVLARMSNR